MDCIGRKLVAFTLACSAGALSATAAVPLANPSGIRTAVPAVFGAPVIGKDRSDARLVKLDASLNLLVKHVSASGAAPTTAEMHRLAPQVRLRSDVPRSTPSVLVDVTVKGTPAAAKAKLVALGMTKPSVFSNLVSGWLPVEHIVSAAALAEVATLRASRMHTRTGSVTTQGDFVQRSNLLRASTLVPNLMGTGITVGVLSDSFDCIGTYSSGVDTYATDVSTGDLPPGVNILEDFGGQDGSAPCTDQYGDETTDEGRAMAQVIYDIAPGTKLAFYTADDGEADFANGIVNLAAAGATVITDDVGYYDEPIFQDGIVAQAIDTVEAQGVAYFSAAGNDARQSWEGPWTDSGTQGASGAGNDGEELMQFVGSDGTTSNFLPIQYYTDSAGDQYVETAVLEWDQPYVTGAPDSGGATSSLDICQTDQNGVVQTYTDPSTGTVYQQCSGLNITGTDSFSIVQFLTPGNTALGGLAVSLAQNTSPPKNLKIVFADDGYGTQAMDPFATYSGTIQGHPSAAGAAAIGATYWRHTPVCSSTLYPMYMLETFSSSGGDPILFDVNGARLAKSVVRQKPDFVAPDGGATSFFGSNTGATVIGGTAAICDIPPNSFLFRGTSEAAPHAAGVAALLQQAQPGVSPTQIYAALSATAIDMTAPGLDFDSGAGFIQADAALTQVLPAISITPASLAFGTSIVGVTTASQVATLTNSGYFPLTISSITAAPDFPESNTCPVAPATIAPSAGCSITVSFDPTHDGTLAENIVIASNVPGGPTDVALSGQGTYPAISLSPTSLTFIAHGISDSGYTPPQTITVTSSGDAPVTLSGFALTGEYQQTNNCASTLAVGASCQVQVTMSTSLDSLKKTGSLSVASNSPKSPATASLNGQIVSRTGGGAMPFWLILPGLAAVRARRRRRR